MNHQKTKTIQKRSIDKSVLLGLLIFASLLESCGRNVISKKDNKDLTVDGQEAKKEFLNFIGSCNYTYSSFLELVEKDARENGKEVTKGDKNAENNSFAIPKDKKIEFNGKSIKIPYLRAIVTEAVADTNSKKKDVAFKLQDGISGKMRELMEEVLVSKKHKASSSKDPKLFIIAKYIQFTEESKKVLSDTNTQDLGNLIAQLKGYLAEFNDHVGRVKRGTGGVGIIIDIKKDSGIEFETLPEPVSFTGQGRTKEYILSDSLIGWINTNVYKKIDEQICLLDKKLKLANNEKPA